MKPPQVTAVIVSYNRRALLERCLISISNQSQCADRIVVVDNASTDSTVTWLREWIPANLPGGELLALDKNTGGAGGFSIGLKHAIESGADWVWMMDDDAAPHPTALDELMKVAIDRANVYGSAAVNGSHMAWTITQTAPTLRTIDDLADLPDRTEVEFLPFLGILVHRDLVAKIGLPDASFFIAADDVEYCLRARRAGARVVIAGRSQIEHPRTQRRVKRVLGFDVVYLSLAPWKRYYDTRNRLLIARKYYGLRLFTQTIPGSFVRLFTSLIHEPNKSTQLWAWCCGMTDGLLGIKGNRHLKWGIRL